MTAHRTRPGHETEDINLSADVLEDEQPDLDEANESFWDVVRRRTTYRHITYLLLSLPLGLLSFAVMVVGFSSGLILVPLYIGLPILAFTLVLMSRLMRLEVQVCNRLLGTSIPLPTAFRVQSGWGGWLRTLDQATTPSYVSRALFLLLRFPLGLISFSAAFATLGFVLSAIAFPIIAALAVLFHIPFAPQIFGNPLDSLYEWVIVLLLIPITIGGGIHLLEFGAWIWRGIARWLLGGASPFQDESAEAEWHTPANDVT